MDRYQHDKPESPFGEPAAHEALQFEGRRGSLARFPAMSLRRGRMAIVAACWGLLLLAWRASPAGAQDGPPLWSVAAFETESDEPAGTGETFPSPFRDGEEMTRTENGGSGPELPDRPLGSAFFGGERGPKVFGVAPPEAGKVPVPWPDLKTPGPDMGDYPNSAYTLPKGRCYIEFSPATYGNADRHNPPSYNAPFLLRYGLTDDVEFRLFANGLTHDGGQHPETGFSPLGFDMKVHLWDDRKEWLIPAVSLEVFIQSVWGSKDFNGGWQPSIALNFDLPITKKLNLEWTVGFAGVRDAVDVVTGERFIPRHFRLDPVFHRANLTVNQPTAQWALEYELTDKVEVFFHGFHNGAILFQQGSGEMIGTGVMWTLTPALMFWGSVNTGLTPSLPSFNTQVGIVVAM